MSCKYYLTFFRSTQNYLNCLNNAAKHCDVNGALLQDLIEKARGQIPLHCKLIFLMNPFISSYLYDNIWKPSFKNEGFFFTDLGFILKQNKTVSLIIFFQVLRPVLVRQQSVPSVYFWQPFSVCCCSAEQLPWLNTCFKQIKYNFSSTVCLHG